MTQAPSLKVSGGTMRARSFLLLLLCVLSWGSLAACKLQTPLPEGVVATVNGEPIQLRSVQALLDTRSAGLGVLQSPGLEQMKQDYASALGTLIIHTLIRQELHAHEIPVNGPALDREVAKVRRDYAAWGKDNKSGKQGLAAYLVDASLDEGHWLELMRDQVAIQTFERRILLPEIHVDLAEIRQYYQEHAEDFHLPDRYQLRALAAASKEQVLAFCEALKQGKKRLPPRVQVHFIEIPVAEVPSIWHKDLSKLKAGQCATPRQVEGQWQTLSLMERLPAQDLDIATAYPLIEKILLEQKKAKAFEAWLEKTLQKAKVRVSPLLRDTLSGTKPLQIQSRGEEKAAGQATGADTVTEAAHAEGKDAHDAKDEHGTPKP